MAGKTSEDFRRGLDIKEAEFRGQLLSDVNHIRSKVNQVLREVRDKGENFDNFLKSYNKDKSNQREINFYTDERLKKLEKTGVGFNVITWLIKILNKIK